MKSVKSAPAAFRFDPTVKASLAFIAERDGRSMANMLEWLIRRHCESEGLGWPPKDGKRGGPEAESAHKSGRVSATSGNKAKEKNDGRF